MFFWGVLMWLLSIIRRCCNCFGSLGIRWWRYRFVIVWVICICCCRIMSVWLSIICGICLLYRSWLIEWVRVGCVGVWEMFMCLWGVWCRF